MLYTHWTFEIHMENAPHNVLTGKGHGLPYQHEFWDWVDEEGCGFRDLVWSAFSEYEDGSVLSSIYVQNEGGDGFNMDARLAGVALDDREVDNGSRGCRIRFTRTAIRRHTLCML